MISSNTGSFSPWGSPTSCIAPRTVFIARNGRYQNKEEDNRDRGQFFHCFRMLCPSNWTFSTIAQPFIYGFQNRTSTWRNLLSGSSELAWNVRSANLNYTVDSAAASTRQLNEHHYSLMENSLELGWARVALTQFGHRGELMYIPVFQIKHNLSASLLLKQVRAVNPTRPNENKSFTERYPEEF